MKRFNNLVPYCFIAAVFQGRDSRVDGVEHRIETFNQQ